MMIKILADASLPGLQQAFPPPFALTCFNDAEDMVSKLPGQTILLCRSTLRVNERLLQGHSLRYIATASSGIDHIDERYAAARDITILDAKGSNATAVADYVMASLAWLRLYRGWQGRKAGVIGYGAVGSQVGIRLKAAGFEVLAYDPPKTARENGFVSCSRHELTQCELLCVHANLHRQNPYPSYNLLDQSFLHELQTGTAIINASRGNIVDENDLLNLHPPLFYCTDVYEHEPSPNPRLVDLATLCTPHIAGHSVEAKQNAIDMVSRKLHAAFQLNPPPDNFLPDNDFPATISPGQDWVQTVLSLYDPGLETGQLKADTDKKACFLKLRKAHRTRHDFNSYDSSRIDEQTRRILGVAGSLDT